MMDFLLEPNVAYLILLAGVMLGFLALVTPGTGVFEVAALFCILLAGYAVYNLSFNGWALVLLVLSVVPFIYAIQRPKRGLFLGLSILLLIVGSVFIFPSKEGLFAVHPAVAILASALVAGFLWLAIQKSMEAAGARPLHDLDGVLGRSGEARTDVHEEGSVYVGGELWSARSENRIQAGSHVRVVRRDGFVIVVEKINQINS
jgi:membrane-bound serine protease (ClpP class)